MENAIIVGITDLAFSGAEASEATEPSVATPTYTYAQPQDQLSVGSSPCRFISFRSFSGVGIESFQSASSSTK